MQNSNPEPGSDKPDPGQLEARLDLELMQKRASRLQTKGRQGRRRMLAYCFLFLVVTGAVLAFFLFFSSR